MAAGQILPMVKTHFTGSKTTGKSAANICHTIIRCTIRYKFGTLDCKLLVAIARSVMVTFPFFKDEESDMPENSKSDVASRRRVLTLAAATGGTALIPEWLLAQ